MKIKSILFNIFRYSLATLLLVSGIVLSICSGIFTFIMYTSNYIEQSLQWWATGGLACIMQLLVLLLSLGKPVFYLYAPQHYSKICKLLLITMVLSIIGSVAFFTGDTSSFASAEPPYNEVIGQVYNIFVLGIFKKLIELGTIQLIAGVWAISIIIEFLVIFLPDLALSIFTGQRNHKPFNNDNKIGIKDFILILLFSRDKLHNFKDILLIPTQRKVKARVNEVKGITYDISKKTVITSEQKEKQKGYNPSKKVTTLYQSGANEKNNDKTQEQKVIPLNTKAEKISQASINYNLVEAYIKEEYRGNEILRSNEVKTKFNLGAKQWQNIMKKLKLNEIIYTKGTTSFVKEGNGTKKVITPKNKKEAETEKKD